MRVGVKGAHSPTDLGISAAPRNTISGPGSLSPGQIDKTSLKTLTLRGSQGGIRRGQFGGVCDYEEERSCARTLPDADPHCPDHLEWRF